MIDKYLLFKGKDIQINEKIIIHHPTLEEVFEYGEQNYISIIHQLTSTPFDMKVRLFDIGIDYEHLTDFQLFLVNFQGLKSSNVDMSIIFNLDFNNFEIKHNTNIDEPVLYSEDDDIIIDESIYMLITECIRSINFLTRNNDKAGNQHAKQYLIDKDRRKMQRDKYKQYDYPLLNLVSSMTNSKEFKYNYDTVWTLPIYVFYDAVKRIQKIKSVENIMTGIYTGNVKSSDIPENNLNWFSNHE